MPHPWTKTCMCGGGFWGLFCMTYYTLQELAQNSIF
ncbi:hypothetical protein QTP70_029880 [Hemibagrus guttatus]|uniref:EGF-like domain-containing protein n=1 Tax=Hemibagrus guttatus TaxID=175788 RepID=A0AAE0QLX5_9TELE|nr:hypothetical protein QTP70_029880 [Hemibagrus guttatus]